MAPPPGLKHFLRHGLSGVNLPEKTKGQIRLALALNFQDKAKFLAAMKSSGLDPEKLGLIFDSETHQSKEMENLEIAKDTGLNTKVWQAGSCCKGMDGEEVPINANFSNGKPIAHGRDGCQCSTNYKKEAINSPEGKIFSRREVGSMSLNEYAANRTRILEQYASGQIK